MNCEIFSNIQSKKLRDKIFEFNRAAESKPIGRERQAVIDSLPWLVFCDGQFHGKTKGSWGADVVTGRCPQHAGFAAVTHVQKLSPEKEKAMTFASFIDSNRQLDDIRAWINGKEQTLLIFGDVGRGKTHLAKATQYCMVDQGKSVEMLTAPHLAELFHEAQPFRDDHQTRTEAKRRLNRLVTADCLIIDDLGLESNTQTFTEGFQGVLDSMRGRLIITTNLRIDRSIMEQSMYRYGDRIFSRINNGARTVRLKGGDFRKRVAA